jgi:DNA repair protein RecO
VHWIAKGVYRPTSRYFAALDLFDTLELEWDANARRELATLRSGRIVRRRRGLTCDLGAYHAGLSVLELIGLVSHPSQSEAALFELCEQTLNELDLARVGADRTLVVFELALLQNLGLAPSLETCAACGGGAPPVPSAAQSPAEPGRERVAFSAGAGGRLCRRCADEARAHGRRVGTLPLHVLRDAQDLLRASFGSADTPSRESTTLPQERIDRVRDFVERFMDYHLERQPRTHRAFLSTPNRNAANLAHEPA